MEDHKVKILGVSASRRHANTETAVSLCLKAAENTGYAETEYLSLADYDLKPCDGCMQCFGWQAPADGGPACFKFNDDTEYLNNKTMETDGLILATPIYIWGATSLMRIYLEKLNTFGSMSFSRFEGKLRGKAMGVITV